MKTIKVHELAQAFNQVNNNMKVKKVNSLEELKQICSGSDNQGYTQSFHIGNGILRSSKDIYYDGKAFEIMHNVDGSCESLTEEEMIDTNIYRAIKAGNFYHQIYE